MRAHMELPAKEEKYSLYFYLVCLMSALRMKWRSSSVNQMQSSKSTCQNTKTPADAWDMATSNLIRRRITKLDLLKMDKILVEGKYQLLIIVLNFCRYMKIAPAKGKNTKQVVRSKDVPADCRTIYVGNLPYDITEDQVGDKFRKFGEIDQVRFAINFSNKKFKGKLSSLTLQVLGTSTSSTLRQ